jgi:hypothetical protein
MRLSRLVPACVIAAPLLIAPVWGREPGFAPQSQGSAAGRGSTQTPPATQGKGQAPTPTATPGQSGQPGQKPQPSAEQFLGWDWWKDEAVKKEMKLTDAQVRSISNYFNSRVQYVTPIYEEYGKQFQELDRMSRERTVEVSVFEMQVIRVESLRTKLNETRTVMLYRINKMLDTTQYQKLREIRDRRRGGRGGGSPTPRSW